MEREAGGLDEEEALPAAEMETEALNEEGMTHDDDAIAECGRVRLCRCWIVVVGSMGRPLNGTDNASSCDIVS